MNDTAGIIHHVFFWLKEPSAENQQKLLEGLKTLALIKTVRKLYFGVPALTQKRDVVENSYHASELMFFDTLADQQAYQTDPIHIKFVENCSHLWNKVIVYDVQDVRLR